MKHAFILFCATLFVLGCGPHRPQPQPPCPCPREEVTAAALPTPATAQAGVQAGTAAAAPVSPPVFLTCNGIWIYNWRLQPGRQWYRCTEVLFHPGCRTLAVSLEPITGDAVPSSLPEDPTPPNQPKED